MLGYNMHGIRAETIMSTIDRQAGSLSKYIQIGTNEFLPPLQHIASSSSPKNDVSLSSAALEIATILKRSTTNSNASAASFDSFIQNMHSELSAKGKDADILKEIPKSNDPGRVGLAKQAANYLLNIQYGAESLYDDASSDNPFESLDRKSLSSIAFDDSGAFTSAERQVAFFELSTRDAEFRIKVYDTQPHISVSDGFQGQITTLLADASLVSAMSEAEQSWREWPSSEELTARASLIMDSSGKEAAPLPSYQNLKGTDNSVLAAVTNKEGSTSWKNISIKDLNSSALAVSLIDSSFELNLSPLNKSKSVSGSLWVSLYTEIDSFRK